MLSIVLTNYNYAHYLPECFESILRQDFTDYELVIVDDHSQDDSIKVINQYASKFPKVKIIQNQRNQGHFLALQRGIDETQGKYLYSCAADDRILPKFFSETMNLFQKHPDLKMVCSDFRYFSEGSAFDERKLLSVKNPQVFTKTEVLNAIKQSGFSVPGPSVIFLKSLWTEYGGYDSKLVTLSDWFLFQKIALFEGVGYVPKTLTEVRLHGRSYTSRVKQDKRLRRSIYRHLLKQLSKDKETRLLFEESGLLDFIFRELYIRLLVNPTYRAFWPYLYRHVSLKL